MDLWVGWGEGEVVLRGAGGGGGLLDCESLL
jgi:hypothetical protein